jgi:hypothetical protein
MKIRVKNGGDSFSIPKINTLNELLSKINNANIHREVDFGKSIGKENW